MPVVPLRAAPPPDLAIYGKLPGVERVVISPSGNRIAMIGMVDGKRQLIVLDQGKDAQGKAAPIAYALEDAKIRGLYWAGEDRVLLFKSDTTTLFGYTADKTELFSMVVLPLNGEKPWSVFQNYKLVTGGVRGFYGIQERDGRYYGYFSGITYTRDVRGNSLTSYSPILYEVDLQDQRPREIGERFLGGPRQWVMMPGGKIGAMLDYTSKTGAWIIRDGAGNRLREGVNPLGRIDLIGLGATPGTLVYAEELKGEEERWYELPLAGGEPKEILADTALGNAYFDEKSRQFVGYRTEGNVPAYIFFGAYRQKVVNATLKAFPGSFVKLVHWNDRFDRVVAMTEGPSDPQTWWIVDIKTGQATELGYSYPIGAAEVGPMQMVKYKAGDGLEIEGILTLPPGREAKKLPVLIFPHGGPASRDYPGFDWWAQAFASHGYAVLQPNFRGSTGYGAAFRRAGNGQWGRKMQSDLSDGLAFLVAQGIADPKRACIMGASYGGYAALAGVTLQKGLYRCAVAVAGVSDVAKMAVTDLKEAGGNRTLKRALEEEVGQHRDLGPISPVNFAAQADAPIMLIHGKDDVVVPFDQSNAMASALKAAGKPFEMVTLAGEDHWLSRGETRLAMLQAAVRFVEANNPADPAP